MNFQGDIGKIMNKYRKPLKENSVKKQEELNSIFLLSAFILSLERPE